MCAWLLFSLSKGNGRQQLYLLAQQIPLQGLWLERVRATQVTVLLIDIVWCIQQNWITNIERNTATTGGQLKQWNWRQLAKRDPSPSLAMGETKPMTAESQDLSLWYHILWQFWHGKVATQKNKWEERILFSVKGDNTNKGVMLG